MEQAWYNFRVTAKRESVSTRRKTCPSATVCAAKSREDSTGTEPRRPETDNCLSYGTTESSLKMGLRSSIMFNDRMTAHLITKAAWT
jgi:hypothetical protein